MITNALIELVLYIGRFIIGLFPAYTGLPAGMTQMIDWVFGALASVSDFFPMDTVFTIFFLWASIELTLMFIKMALWVFLGKSIRGGVMNAYHANGDI